jgi:hypothetical protein
MRGISWVAQDVLASQEGRCSMEWVSKKYELKYYSLLIIMEYIYTTDKTV